MQAYQTAPCPYCGATWNPPGAQTCGNCHNQLPPPPPAYAPPGYTPGQGQSDQPQYQDPNQPYSPPQAYPPGQPQYGQPEQPQYGQPAQPGYEQPGYPAPNYGQAAPGYTPPAQPGYGYQDPGQAYQPGGYPTYAPQPGGYPSYEPPSGYAAEASGQYAQAPGAAPATGTTINFLGYPITIPASVLAFLPKTMPALPSVALPQVRPGAILGRLKPLLWIVGAIVVVWVFLTAVVPALANANLQATSQAIAAAIAHRPAVDAAMAQAFTPTRKDPMADVAGAQAAMDALRSKNQAALDQVKADETTLTTLDQHLGWLSPVSGSRSGEVGAARQRAQAALAALQKADQVLTAAVDQDKQMLQLFSSITLWRTMSDDLNKHDPASAVALYPDANGKLQTAIQMSQGADIPPAAAAYTKNFQSVLDNTEQLATSVQARDNAGIAKYTNQMGAAIRAQQFDVAGAAAWIAKTYQPLITAYDAGMRGLK